MASKEKAWEMQARESPEAKAEPNREEKQKTKAFSQRIIPDYWMFYRENSFEMFICSSF